MANLKPKKILPKVNNGKRAGAPSKENRDDIIRPDGLTVGMHKRKLREAEIQDISPAALNRRVWDWYFTALDTQRGDVSAHELFDDIVAKEVEKDKHKQ